MPPKAGVYQPTIIYPSKFPQSTHTVPRLSFLYTRLPFRASSFRTNRCSTPFCILPRVYFRLTSEMDASVKKDPDTKKPAHKEPVQLRGTRGGTRTLTTLLSPDFESSASASSATLARIQLLEEKYCKTFSSLHETKKHFACTTFYRTIFFPSKEPQMKGNPLRPERSFLRRPRTKAAGLSEDFRPHHRSAQCLHVRGERKGRNSCPLPSPLART